MTPSEVYADVRNGTAANRNEAELRSMLLAIVTYRPDGPILINEHVHVREMLLAYIALRRDEKNAADEDKRHEENVALTRRSNELSVDAVELAKAANKLSRASNRASWLAIIIAVIACVPPAIQLFHEFHAAPSKQPAQSSSGQKSQSPSASASQGTNTALTTTPTPQTQTNKAGLPTNSPAPKSP
jgi:hypothetical protein